jgi:hypothetical protein
LRYCSSQRPLPGFIAGVICESKNAALRRSYRLRCA